jgi:hypothetical protein
LRAPDLPATVLDLSSVLAAGSLPEVPPIIQRSVIAPYLDGLAFVNALRRRGGWQAVGRAWQRLPTSTEQILHIEKYDANEAPEALPAVPPAASGPVLATYSDVYGEQTLRILFEEWMPASVARAAASGWSGDRMTSFSDGQVTSVAWRVRYDDGTKALNALHAFARGVLAEEDHSPDGQPAFVSAADAERATLAGQVCRERHRRGPFAVLRRGRELAVTLGPFRRNSESALSEGDCVTALRWAAALLAP